MRSRDFLKEHAHRVPSLPNLAIGIAYSNMALVLYLVSVRSNTLALRIRNNEATFQHSITYADKLP